MSGTLENLAAFVNEWKSPRHKINYNLGPQNVRSWVIVRLRKDFVAMIQRLEKLLHLLMLALTKLKVYKNQQQGNMMKTSRGVSMQQVDYLPLPNIFPRFEDLLWE